MIHKQTLTSKCRQLLAHRDSNRQKQRETDESTRYFGREDLHSIAADCRQSKSDVLSFTSLQLQHFEAVTFVIILPSKYRCL